MHQKVMRHLEWLIKEKMKPNEKLPSERELMKEYGVSRSTIRSALSNLEQRGLIYRLHGKGTYVAMTFLSQTNLAGMYSFTDLMSSKGLRPKTKNISLELAEPAAEIAAQLDLKTGEKAYALRRLRSASGEPLIYSTSYLPARLFPHLTLADLQHNHLYSVMKQKYGQISVMAFEDVQAVTLNRQESKILHLQEGDPSLKINRRTINDKNVAVEFTQALARGDKFVYRSKQYNPIF